MAIELVTSLFLILCANMISRLIERRRDVLYYVKRSTGMVRPARSEHA